MKRHVKVGPERIEASFGTVLTYLEELKAHGVPDEAKVSFNTAPDGVVLTSIDYDEEVGSPTQANY